MSERSGVEPRSGIQRLHRGPFGWLQSYSGTTTFVVALLVAGLLLWLLAPEDDARRARGSGGAPAIGGIGGPGGGGIDPGGIDPGDFWTSGGDLGETPLGQPPQEAEEPFKTELAVDFKTYDDYENGLIPGPPSVTIAPDSEWRLCWFYQGEEDLDMMIMSADGSAVRFFHIAESGSIPFSQSTSNIGVGVDNCIRVDPNMAPSGATYQLVIGNNSPRPGEWMVVIQDRPLPGP